MSSRCNGTPEPEVAEAEEEHPADNPASAAGAAAAAEHAPSGTEERTAAAPTATGIYPFKLYLHTYI